MQKDNGGNDVKHYVVEKRIAGTDKWTKVGPPVSGTTCDVRGLEDGQNYEFRVSAENDNGVSILQSKLNGRLNDLMHRAHLNVLVIQVIRLLYNGHDHKAMVVIQFEVMLLKNEKKELTDGYRE